MIVTLFTYIVLVAILLAGIGGSPVPLPPKNPKPPSQIVFKA